MAVRTRIGRWLRVLAGWVDPDSAEPGGVVQARRRLSDEEAAQIAARWRASHAHGWPFGQR